VTFLQHLHFEFANWWSLAIIIGLVLGIIGWISYVALSISFLKKSLPYLVTREEMQQMFADFKKEIRHGT